MHEEAARTPPSAASFSVLRYASDSVPALLEACEIASRLQRVYPYLGDVAFPILTPRHYIGPATTSATNLGGGVCRMQQLR